ncbi:MAG: DegV family protein [Nanoarchaeota archaeon]
MKLKLIDGHKFFVAFKNGAYLVEKNKKYLNEINLFPVPDNDTGNNMANTLVSTAVKVQSDPSISRTITAISNNILKFARGNSGLILAQFFNGLNKKIKNKDKINTKDFAESVNKVVPSIYENIENPQEGTMITIIKKWAESLSTQAEDIEDFVSLFSFSLNIAKKSLLETKEQLEVLKKNNTVDAGAQGFVYFLEGILQSWKNNGKNIDERFKDEGIDKLNFEEKYVNKFDLSSANLKYRYCTEILMIKDLEKDMPEFLLKEKGDSLISVDSNTKKRIHIHTNDPAGVVNILRNKGKIIEQKVDDMQFMQKVTNKSKNMNQKIALVTDSIADIPKKLKDKYQIHMIPVNIFIDGVNYLDKLTITPEYFFEYLEKAQDFPSSSHPNAEYIYKYFKKIIDYYDSIIIISVSKELSGTINSFRKAKEKINKTDDIDINIINSKLNSGAQGLLVLKAAEEISKGKSFQEIIKIIKKYREKTKIFVSVETFDYMVKGGRVGSIKGFFANLFNLKPIVSLDQKGKGTLAGKSISTKGVRKKIFKKAEKIKKDWGIEKYAIVHARAPKKAQNIAKKFERILEQKPEYIMEISPVVALNAGPGAVALSIMGGNN